MNSSLERRKVRLCGPGGPAVCGVPRTRASATGLPDQIPKRAQARRNDRGNPRKLGGG